MQKAYFTLSICLLACLLAASPRNASCAAAPKKATNEKPISELAPQEAFAMINDKAEKGDAAAMLSLGRFYEYGHGTSRNFSRALEWYGKAADAGLPEGLYNLGVCYEVGMGTTSNEAKAAEFFKKAADKKLPLAMHKMAALYFSGNGVPKDEVQAVQYLIKAGEAGLPQAANDIGLVYMNGLYGQVKDHSVALDWFIYGADQGSLDAMANIAAYFDEDTPVKANLGKAMKWYLILKKLGINNDNVNSRVAVLGKKLNQQQNAAAEKEADAWLKSFRAKAD